MAKGLIKDLGNGRVAIQKDQGFEVTLYDGSVEERHLAPSSIRAVGWAVGDIRQSFLDEAQFQLEADTSWVLCDGRNVAGSDYDTVTGSVTIPDVRGEFLRSADNGRGVDAGRTVRTTQGDSTALPNNPLVTDAEPDHTHTTDFEGDHTHTIYRYINLTGGVLEYTANNDDGTEITEQSGSAGGHDHNVLAGGGHSHGFTGGDPETRPRNVACNTFIKINR